MLAIKMIKITKKGISSSRIKVMHSLQSKKYASQWFNSYKNPSYYYTSQLIWVELQSSQWYQILAHQHSGVSHYLLQCGQWFHFFSPNRLQIMQKHPCSLLTGQIKFQRRTQNRPKYRIHMLTSGLILVQTVRSEESVAVFCTDAPQS